MCFLLINCTDVILLISLIGGIFPENKVEEEIEKSYITKAMYENNLINVLLK